MTECPKEDHKEPQDPPEELLIKPNQTPACSSRALGIFPMALSVLSLSLAGFLTWEVWSLHKKILMLEQKNTQSLHLLTNTARQNASFEQILAQYKTEQESTQNTIQKLTQRINQQDPLVLEKNDLRLNKAKNLLELSAMNAIWSPKPALNIALLQQADTLLSENETPQIVKIRQSIADEIQAWQNVSLINKQELLNTIDSLSQMIINLAPIDEPPSPAPQGPQTSSSRFGMRYSLQHTIDALKKLVIVEYHDPKTTPFFGPNHALVLKDGILLKLYQAQMALLFQDEILYKTSLTEAKTLCQNILSKSHQFTRIQEKFDALIAIDIHPPELPEAKALSQLNQLINEGESSS